MLDRDSVVSDKLCLDKNDYKSGSIFYGLFLAPKNKYCLTIDKFDIIQDHMIFKELNDFEKPIRSISMFQNDER